MLPRWLDYEPPSLCHTGLEALSAIASIGGTLLSASASSDDAAYKSAIARRQAVLDKQKANEEAALGQRNAETQQRKADLVQSRARALAAASGTVATSPTEIAIEQDIAAQGGYNALSSLYEGASRARASSYQGDIDLFKANRIEAAAPLQVGGTLLSGLSQTAGLRSKSKSKSLLKLFGD